MSLPPDSAVELCLNPFQQETDYELLINNDTTTAIPIPDKIQQIQEILGDRLDSIDAKIENYDQPNGAAASSSPVILEMKLAIHREKGTLIQDLYNALYYVIQKELNTENLQNLLILFNTALDPTKSAYKILAKDTGDYSCMFNFVFGPTPVRWNPGTISDLIECHKLLQQELTERLTKEAGSSTAPTTKPN